MNTLPTHSNDIGVVTQKTTGTYRVSIDSRTVNCRLSSAFRAPSPTGRGDRSRRSPQRFVPPPTDPIAVGDLVRIIEHSAGGSIVEILPRRNQFSRRSAVPMPTAQAGEQVIAANVDQFMPVFSAAQPPPSWNLLDRYLATAEIAGLPVIICVTKLDLIQTPSGAAVEDLNEIAEEYRRIGYRVVFVSTHTGEGLADIHAALTGQVTVMAGKSGVGKTSLLNALQPGLGLRVGAVSQVHGKGRHTTTIQEMFPLEGGGALIDTPGMREFGLWQIDGQDLAWAFPEMRPYLGQCKFGAGCTHDVEPGCAVRQAVNAGLISPRRYKSYIRIFES